MAALSRTQEISTPVVYHREYENDLPKKGEVVNPFLSQCLRVTQVALPFLSLYKPLGQPLSIVLGSTRVISSVAQMINAISSGDACAAGKRKSVLEVAIATTALALSIFVHPLGMLFTTTHDMIMNLFQLVQAMEDGDYAKAAEIGLHLVNNALYFGCFFAGSLEWSIASIGMQMFLGLYHSCDEFKKGNYLEGFGHLLMVGVRGTQMQKMLADAQAIDQAHPVSPKTHEATIQKIDFYTDDGYDGNDEKSYILDNGMVLIFRWYHAPFFSVGQKITWTEEESGIRIGHLFLNHETGKTFICK